MPHLGKTSAGADSFGHVWENAHDVVEVTDEQALELLAIPDGGFYERQPDHHHDGHTDAGHGGRESGARDQHGQPDALLEMADNKTGDERRAHPHPGQRVEDPHAAAHAGAVPAQNPPAHDASSVPPAPADTVTAPTSDDDTSGEKSDGEKTDEKSRPSSTSARRRSTGRS